MQRPAKRNTQLDPEAIAFHEDGELYDSVFCLHCHTINATDATYCKFCQNPLLEAPSDLRDRLERIRERGSQREDEWLVEAAFNQVDQAVSGVGTIIFRPFTRITNIFRAVVTGSWRLIGLLLTPFYWAGHLLQPPFEREVSQSSTHRKPLKHAVNILQKFDKAGCEGLPADANEYRHRSHFGDATKRLLIHIRDTLNALFFWQFIVAVWVIVTILILVDILLFSALSH